MTTQRIGLLRRHRLHLLAGAALVTAVLYALSASAAPVIPVPNPIVVVTTKSFGPYGTVERVTPVPIGGVPVPIDVDDKLITGLLTPDIDVSVGLVAFDELPGSQLVPNVVIKRNALAVARNLPAPPLNIDAKIELRDAGNGFRQLAEIHYGYSTPPGAKVPPVVTAKLVGPAEGGFVDPLQAKIESPGYDGPLDVNLSATTEELDANFHLAFDPLPERIYVEQDPREDGLDALYTHAGPTADVQLDAFATLRNRTNDELLEVGADIERLPSTIRLHNTNADGATNVVYEHVTPVAKPDIAASFRDLDGDGNVVTDAEIRVAGVPAKMQGDIATAEGDDGPELDEVDFRVLDGEQIDAVEFVARNWDGDPQGLPEPELGPDQHIAFAKRRTGDETSRYRAAGRLLGIRAARFELVGPGNDDVDATTDIGDGVKPLRVVADVDDRGPGAPDDAQRLKLDTTLTPLPRTIHALFEPTSGGDDPMRVTYDASSTLDVDADVVLAQGPADGCGQPLVTCASARIDKVPTHLGLELPGPEGKDFKLDHDGGPGLRPDVRATIDRTPEIAADRVWVRAALLRIPNDITGRIDVSKKDVLRAAEFHACRWDFGSRACTGAQGAIGQVDFTVRDRPSRLGLPPRPDTVRDHVAIVSRDPAFGATGDERFEINGSVREVRNVEFHQRDANEDGEEDGTLGVLVDMGLEDTPFDAAVDSRGFAAEPDDEELQLGTTATELFVHVHELPSRFETCVRNADLLQAPPSPDELSPEPLLADCDRTDVLGRADGDLDVTPMAVVYRASEPTVVDGKLRAEAPDPEDRDEDGAARLHTTVFDARVDRVPAVVRADVIPSVTPKPTADPPITGRKLELAYLATEADGDPTGIDTITVRDLQLRRSNSVCSDPRPRREATCLSATLHDLPSSITATYDPDDTKGDLELTTAAPADGDDKLSIDPLRLESVSPEPDASPLVLTGAIRGLTPRISGKVVRADLDDKPGRDLAEIVINACLDEEGDDRCNGDQPWGDGIESVAFDARNALVGQTIADPLQGVTGDRVSFTTRGEDFRAAGEMSAVREVLLSRRHPETGAIIPSTRLRAGFGKDSASAAIRAYVDLKDGITETLADAILRQPPKAFTACLRDPVRTDQVVAGSTVWCEQQGADRRAVQVGVELPESGRRPDIELRRLLLANATRTSVLTGKANIVNLGDRIDVLAARELREGPAGPGSCTDGEDNDADTRPDADDADCRTTGPDVLVEGRDSDGELGDVAGRIDVDLQNYLNSPEDEIGPPAGADAFPWAPLHGEYDDPANDGANDDGGSGDDPGGRNFVKAATDPAGRFLVSASVPHVRRLGARPGPCYTDDRVREPDEFSTTRDPRYTCVRVNAAAGRKLGLAVRTLDALNQALAFEEGRFDTMPAGADGLEATVALSPQAAANDPLCDEAVPQPCRPPMLSLANDREDQAPEDTRLVGRVAVGELDLVRALKGVTPRDEPSARLDYEGDPAGWPSEAHGARVKLGTDPKLNKTALRIGLNLDLPRYLDAYTPTTWSCKHTSPNSSNCDAGGVGSEFNTGYESSDIFLKFVGAESEHDGADLDYLGRFAVLSHSFGQTGQIVLTGAPEPNGTNPFGKAATGASSVFPENQHELSPTNPSIYGAKLPGHLDVKVFVRNDFAADQDITPFGIGDNKNQQHYTQIDGRINRPLSLQLRLNKDLKDTRVPGHSVAGVQLSALNLPGTDNQNTFDEPSFRVRSELRPSYDGSTLLSDAMPYIGALKGLKAFLDALKKFKSSSLFYVTPVLPTNVQPGWLDVKLNADPLSNGNDTTDSAARLVEAVAGPFGALNDADLRGWANVDGTGGELGKGAGGLITPQAALRLREFDLGVEGGVSAFGLVSAGIQLAEVMDIVVGLTGSATERARLSQALTAIGIRKGASGSVRIDTTAEAELAVRVVIEALWGLFKATLVDVRFGKIIQPINFNACPNVFDVRSHGFGTSDFENAALTLGIPDWGSIDGAGGVATATIGSVLSILTNVISPISCAIHLFMDPASTMVDQDNPAPRYAVDQHPLPPGNDAADQPESDDPDEATPPSPDLTLDGVSRVECGGLNVGRLRLINNATLRAGLEGATDAEGDDCDGSLVINAESVEVQAGSTIHARSTRIVTPGPGTGDAPGGGAGHGGSGGDSGTGTDGGGAYDGDDPSQDFGSRGGQGTAGASGGVGGGTVFITAKEDIVVNGTVSVSGAGGTPVAPNDPDCTTVGAGGGSGGTMKLVGLRVRGGGNLFARGGRGGNGARGGGGGSGGRILIESVTTDHPSIQRQGGDGGAAAGACDLPLGLGDGEDGDNGDLVEEELRRAAFVELHEDTPGPIQPGQEVKLRLRMIQDGGGPAAIALCRRFAEDTTTAGVNSPLLDPPPESANAFEVIEGATCSHHVFLAPTVASDEYRRTVEVTEGNGFHGWFALAYDVPCAGSFPFPFGCNVQPSMPQQSSAVIGIDREAPFILEEAPWELNGADGCPGPAKCLNERTGEIGATASDQMSEIARTRCRVNGGDWSSNCGLDSVHLVSLGGGEGAKTVEMEMTDAVGRVTTETVGRWFVDTARPAAPEVEASFGSDVPVNGWHHVKPTVTVEGADDGPSSGFRDDPVTFFVDGGDTRCGEAVDGNSGGGTSTSCANLEVEAEIPADGVHALTARVQDRAGNVSLLDEETTIKVDSTPPTSQVFFGPRAADGSNGWYRTQPFFAFAVSDNLGGSGFDLDVAPSKVRYRIDDGAWATWNPEDEDGSLMPEGRHRVCFYAIDVAGNAESDVEEPGTTTTKPNCSGYVRVDLTPPVAADPIAPAAANGDNGWYVSTPTVTPSAGDPIPGGVNEVSEVDRTQVSLDGGPWLTAAPVAIDEGEHDIRVRAFDAAGNPSAVTERIVRVDRSDPTARVGSHPAAANGHGWFRSQRVISVAASDGRDGSGSDSATFAVDGEGPAPYLAPFVLGEGVSATEVRARDVAGRTGSPVALTSRVDLTAPAATLPGSAADPILLPGQTTILRWTSSDLLTPRVKARVHVFNSLGRLVRRLSYLCGSGDGFCPAGPGQVVWNGRTADDKGVLTGLYHYRVQITDQAGNTVLSTESKPFLVVLGVIPF